MPGEVVLSHVASGWPNPHPTTFPSPALKFACLPTLSSQSSSRSVLGCIWLVSFGPVVSEATRGLPQSQSSHLAAASHLPQPNCPEKLHQ
jgi:hypothetical protein